MADPGQTTGNCVRIDFEMTEPSTIGIEDVPPLIEAAFDTARANGKSDWQRMTTAVLKNRLLQMTEQQFDEAALGFSSIAGLLAEFPNLVRLDHTTRPTTVEFLGEAGTSSPLTAEFRRPRESVRGDLWNAVLNYSAGHGWIWDVSLNQARPIVEGDDLSFTMPTIAKEELSQLRDAFVSNAQTLLANDDSEMERLQRWSMRGLGTAALPRPLQGQWNESLKSLVIERLTHWFEERNISLPDDLVQVKVPSTWQADEELANLRTFVIKCVKSMTLPELASLNLPVGAVLRAVGRRAGHPDGR